MKKGCGPDARDEPRPAATGYRPVAINEEDNMKKTGQSLFILALLIALNAIPIPALSDNTPMAQPENGQVVFYRPSRAKGAAIRFEIHDSSKGSIGALSNGTVIRKDLEPGGYTFSVRAPSVNGSDSITLHVEAGKVYYVKGEILWGWPAGRPKFTRMSGTEAQKELERRK